MTGPIPTSAVTGPIAAEQILLSSLIPGLSPIIDGALFGGTSRPAPSTDPAGSDADPQAEVDLAPFALEGADLATGFQPGGMSGPMGLLSFADRTEQGSPASELHLWLLGAAALSTLGATWIACRRREREAREGEDAIYRLEEPLLGAPAF